MLSALFYVYLWVELTFFFLVSCIALVVCYPFDKSRRVVHEISRLITRIFWLTPPAWRRTIRGLENIDKKQSYIIVINHTSMVDIAALYFLPLNFRWVSKREVFRIPYMGQMLSLHGDIAIDRGRGTESMKKVIADGKMWISRGASIAIFPEGTRSKDGEIHRFKQGAFLLAKEAGVAILPVVMNGTGTTIKPNKMYNWRNHLKLSVLKPISAEEVAGTDASELASKVQGLMTEELARVRSWE